MLLRLLHGFVNRVNRINPVSKTLPLRQLLPGAREVNTTLILPFDVTQNLILKYIKLFSSFISVLLLVKINGTSDKIFEQTKYVQVNTNTKKLSLKPRKEVFAHTSYLTG